MHLKMVIFCLNIKKTDNAAYNYVFKDVKDFIQEIESMSEKINLSLFEDFFESLPADYAKMLINTSLDKNKEIVEETKYRISDLKGRIKEMGKKYKKKIKMLMRHQRLLKKFLITIKMTKQNFKLNQKLIKENQNRRLKKVLQRG